MYFVIVVRIDCNGNPVELNMAARAHVENQIRRLKKESGHLLIFPSRASRLTPTGSWTPQRIVLGVVVDTQTAARRLRRLVKNRLIHLTQYTFASSNKGQTFLPFASPPPVSTDRADSARREGEKCCLANGSILREDQMELSVSRKTLGIVGVEHGGTARCRDVGRCQFDGE
jgi:hypothetical protein